MGICCVGGAVAAAAAGAFNLRTDDLGLNTATSCDNVLVGFISGPHLPPVNCASTAVKPPSPTCLAMTAIAVKLLLHVQNLP